MSLVVCAPHQESGVKASVPYASDVQRESNPRRSASAIASTTPSGGPSLNGSISSPSFMTNLRALLHNRERGGSSHLPGSERGVCDPLAAHRQLLHGPAVAVRI